jgi:hypothetical protein
MVQAKKLVNLFGTGKVSYKNAVLDEYSHDMSFVKALRPQCIVKPSTVGEINKLVDFANRNLSPLVPVSSGAPHFRGDTVPGAGGAIVVDLSGMKRIIRIDRQNRVAMIEPGVTFGELIPELHKAGLRLNMPFVPRKSKSVLGSLLEREPPVMPKYQWDIADPLCCVEVIYGSGDLFRTGAAAGPGTVEEQWASGGAQKEAAGPLQASWYRVIQGAQGTMGIVSWASMRCELTPQLEEPFLVGSSELDKIIDLVHWLTRLRLVNECFVLNNMSLSSLFADKWPDDYRQIKEAVPPWLLFFSIAGYEYFPEERVNSQMEDMKDICQRTGLEPVPALGGVSASTVLAAVQRPCEEPYWKLKRKGGCHDIFFLSLYNHLPRLIETMVEAADAYGYPSSDIGIYLQPIVQGTNCHCEFSLFYDLENLKELERTRELSRVAVSALINKGAFFSRPYGEEAEMILNRDAATVWALKKVKGILDPNNIMNPGKLCF